MADDTLTIVGKCEAIVEKSDWTQFEINVGRKYPVKLSTKLDEIIDQARALKGAEAIWTYTEHQGGENPHKPGTFYTNRYLSSAELVTDANRAQAKASAATGPTSTGGGGSYGRSPEERRSIERQAIVKSLAPLLGGEGAIMGVDDDLLGRWLQVCDSVYDWVTEVPDVPQAASGATEAVTDGGAGAEQPPPHDDEDIPF